MQRSSDRTVRGKESLVAVTSARPRRIGDLDNVLKSLLDSMKGIAFVDDGQIVELRLRRFDDKLRPRVEVTVERVES